MATATAKSKSGPRMSDDAVKAKTGETWSEWFSLNKAGGKKMSHQEIGKLLSTMLDHGGAK